MDELVPVRMSDCRCPGGPHPDGDFAYLRPFLDYAGGAEAYRAIIEATKYPEPDAEGNPTYPRMSETVGPVYIRRGVVDWNKVDEDGNPVPCTPEAVAALRYEDAFALVDKADDLYGQAVLSPLVTRIATYSRGTQTNGSTSATRPRSSKPRSRSGRSSRRTSAASQP